MDVRDDMILECFGSCSVRFTFILTKTVTMLAITLLRLATTMAMIDLRFSTDTIQVPGEDDPDTVTVG